MTTIEQEEKRFADLGKRFYHTWRYYPHLKIVRSNDGTFSAYAFIGNYIDEGDRYDVCVAFACNSILGSLVTLNNKLEARLNGKVE